MGSYVIVEARSISSRKRAAFNSTSKGFLACVGTHVGSQMALLSRRILATLHLTVEGFLVRVGPHVALQATAMNSHKFATLDIALEILTMQVDPCIWRLSAVHVGIVMVFYAFSMTCVLHGVLCDLIPPFGAHCFTSLATATFVQRFRCCAIVLENDHQTTINVPMLA